MITKVLTTVHPKNEYIDSIFNSIHSIYSDGKYLNVKIKVLTPKFFNYVKLLQQHHTIKMFLDFIDDNTTTQVTMTLSLLEFNFTNIIVNEELKTPIYVDLKFLIKHIGIE